jgi:hypothetical protein
MKELAPPMLGSQECFRFPDWPSTASFGPIWFVIFACADQKLPRPKNRLRTKNRINTYQKSTPEPTQKPTNNRNPYERGPKITDRLRVGFEVVFGSVFGPRNRITVFGWFGSVLRSFFGRCWVGFWSAHKDYGFWSADLKLPRAKARIILDPGFTPGSGRSWGKPPVKTRFKPY